MVPKTLLPPCCPLPEPDFIIFMLLTGLQAQAGPFMCSFLPLAPSCTQQPLGLPGCLSCLPRYLSLMSCCEQLPNEMPGHGKSQPMPLVG